MSNVNYQYGGAKGKKHKLVENEALLVVRTVSRSTINRRSFSSKAHSALKDFESVATFSEAGVEVFKCRKSAGMKALRDKVRKQLKKEDDVEFAGRVLADPKSKRAVIYTENFFVKFTQGQSAAKCKKLLKTHGLTITREIPYAPNSYFVSAPENTGMKTFKIAASLLKDDNVDLCHPELVREPSHKQAFSQQWHLKKTTVDGTQINQHANVVPAWSLTEGEGTTVAIIDDGVDTGHEEFTGANKVVFGRDIGIGTDGGTPVSWRDNHGTSCAGVAVANGNHGASGVAPKAALMPIRLSSLSAQDEADAFHWAASHGADVISCSWGPPDGDPANPSDPAHNEFTPLPDSTRLAIDWAVNNGRNGKGCVITWAAGNGNESVENDGYARYDKVIAVAACNDKGKKSFYSDFGPSIWCAFPSDNYGAPALTPGIWTTDRSGSDGYAAGDYADDFGGTSSACPGAAGVAALVISRNPTLRWDQVKDVMKQSCDQIDVAGGNYDANGHSDKYGYGRLNAAKAVSLAMPKAPSLVTLHKATQDVTIKDLKTVKLSVNVGDTKALKDVKVSVDIEHTWRGDLELKLKAPTGGKITLYQGDPPDDVDNLKTTFDKQNVPGLSALIGSNPEGKWTLEVRDRADDDQGKIRSFGVELSF
jgi:subtilisin family serine protease